MKRLLYNGFNKGLLFTALAWVFVIFISILATPTPAFCKSPATRIAISFAPPLKDAPEFGEFILPPEFYELMCVTEDLLINNFTTIQGPQGLKEISFEISSDDPEVALKVYSALVANYPSLVAGEVDFLTGLPRFAIGWDIISDDELQALKDGRLSREEMLNILLDRIIDLPEYTQLTDLGIDFNKMNVGIDAGQLGIKITDGEIAKWLPIGISEELINTFINGKVSAGELRDSIRKSLKEQVLLVPFQFKIPGITAAELDIAGLSNALENLKNLRNLSLDDFLKGGIRFKVEVTSPEELRNIVLSIKDLLMGIGIDEGDFKALVQKIPGIKSLDNIRADQIDDLLKGALHSVRSLVDEDNLKSFERQINHFLKGLKAKIIPRPSNITQPSTGLQEPSAGTPPCPEEPQPSGDISGNVSIHLRSGDKNFDPGKDGYRVIIEKLITSEDRGKLRDGAISLADFEETLAGRLAEVGWLGYNIEITLSDNTAEYKAMVRDGVVTFEYLPAI